MTAETIAPAAKGAITIYACGGAGINTVKKFEQFRDKAELGMATIEPVYIDTSLSNARGIPSDATYVFEGMDGSGKVRSENYKEISRHIREILQKFPPTDLSIVVSSGSGGSGSVIAPSIVSELLEQDKPVIVLMIGATDTRLEIDNTLKTLKSYESIAQLRGAPVVMGYFQNSKETPRGVVDTRLAELISLLMTVFSRENAELDSKDLYNFLHFDKVTSYKSQLASLNVFVNDETAELQDAVTGNTISVVTLLKPDTDVQLPFTPDYQCVGFMPDGISDQLKKLSPLTLVTMADLPTKVSKDMTGRLAELDKAQRARPSAASILSNNDAAQDDGLVL